MKTLEFRGGGLAIPEVGEAISASAIAILTAMENPGPNHGKMLDTMKALRGTLLHQLMVVWMSCEIMGALTNPEEFDQDKLDDVIDNIQAHLDREARNRNDRLDKLAAMRREASKLYN